MKIKKIIDLIKTYDGKGIETEEYPLSNRFIYNLVIMNRSQMLSQRIENQMHAEGYRQSIRCVELIEVPQIDCGCNLEIESMCSLLRTKYPLPRTIGSYLQVTSLDKRTIFPRTTVDKMTYTKGNRYTSNAIRWFLENDYIYLTSSPTVSGINISAYFHDPVDVHNLTDCDGDKNCQNNLELEIFMQEEDLNQIVASVSNYISNLKYVVSDETFDKKDSSYSTYTENPFKRYSNKKE